jgi:hypothetical protein
MGCKEISILHEQLSLKKLDQPRAVSAVGIKQTEGLNA